MGQRFTQREDNSENAELKYKAEMQKWIEQYREYEVSGLSVAEFCRTKGIAKSTFRNRIKRVRETICDQIDGTDRDTSPAIVEVKTIEHRHSSDATISITAEGFSIALSGDISPENLRIIIQELKSC